VAARHELDPETIAGPRFPRERKSHAGFLALLLIVVLILGGAVVWELTQRQSQTKSLAATSIEDAAAKPVVNVARVRMAPGGSVVELPGQTVALEETPLYARVDGYIKLRPVDIGDHVTKGELLVELETPDLDQEVAQAEATLAQSRATLLQLRAAIVVAQRNLNLAKITMDRYKALMDSGTASKQDYDQKLNDDQVAEATVNASEQNALAGESTIRANESNLKRLGEMKTFSRLVAPFDGVITGRNQDLDVGTLISSGNTTAAREIIRVGKLDPLRVFVNVPQTYAPMIQDGQSAELLVDEFPGKVFPAKVIRSTHSLDTNSRTLLVILRAPNPNNTLLPGMYGKVRFSLPHVVNVLMLPADALVMRTSGPEVAVVDSDHRVHFHQVKLGRDYGASLEVNAGLSQGDMVVLNPTDAIRENVVVEPREQEPPAS